jgi:hypothetical protein
MAEHPGHSSPMPRLPTTRMIKLIHDHSEFPSAAALGRAIGEPNLTRKLSRIRTDRLLPSAELLEKIAAHLDPVGRRLLIPTMADDAALPGYRPDDGDPFQNLRIMLRGLDDTDLLLVTELVRRLADPQRDDDPDDQDGSPGSGVVG